MGLDRDVCGIKRLGHTSNHGALWHGITGGVQGHDSFCKVPNPNEVDELRIFCGWIKEVDEGSG